MLDNPNSPKVSVVMSVYNDATYLRLALDSILSQQGVDFEFICIDDGSQDGSADILQEYSSRDQRLRVVRQDNAGLTRALIHGCKLARAPYIARQDADDISLPNRLKLQAKALAEDARLAFVSSQAQVISPTGEVVLNHDRPTNAEEATAMLLADKGGPPGHGSVMFRRDIYDKVGGYRPEFYFAQDVDLWFRLAEQGMINYLPQCLYQYRMAPQSISGNRREVIQQFSSAVRTCRQRRLTGQDESDILQQCLNLRDRKNESTPRSEAETLYFLGRNLLRSNPTEARGYLLKALRYRPLHLKSWLALSLAIPLSTVQKSSKQKTKP
jgi:glycosyltransferase involved in cell wall biosynthesis